MRNAWAQAACLAALVALSVHIKTRQSTGLPRFNPADETGYFKVESAFQYRHAAMVARDIPLPALDRAAQYPEGVRTFRELTTLMEVATGLAYRLRPFGRDLDFRMFVILWVALVSSLTIPALYLAALRLTRDAPLALAASCVYGVSWAATADFIGSYTLQSLALPLLFWSFACYAASLEPGPGQPRAWACASGALMALALASWHVSRFYLGVFFVAAGWAAFRRRGNPDEAGRARESLAALLCFCALAGLALPVLRENRFLFSPAVALGFAVLAALWKGPRAAAAVGGAWAVLFLALRQAGIESSSFGHTYAMIFEKLRFLLVKPADPAALSPEARLLWVGPFNSPETAHLIFTFAPLALVAGPRLLAAFRGRFAPGWPAPGVSSGPAVESQSWVLCDSMAVLSALGTAMISRLAPFFAFFLCLSSARVALPAGSRRRRVALWGLAALALVEGLKTFAPYSRLNLFMMISAPFAREENRAMVSVSNERQVLLWLRERGAGRPVLAHFGVSGPILAYAGGPVILNPKGETLANRRKSMEFLAALYSGEEEFRAFCARYGVGLFLYGTGYVLDESQDGARYSSGSMALAESQAAVLCHFHPERLRHFRLLFQNPDFRIFEFAPGAGPGAPAAPTAAGGKGKPAGGSPAASVPPGDPVYDVGLFSPKRAPDGKLSLDIAGVLARMRVHRTELLKARLFSRMGQREAALEAYDKALLAWPASAAVREDIERLRGGSVPVDPPARVP